MSSQPLQQTFIDLADHLQQIKPQVLTELASSRDWQSSYRQIMLLAKQLPKLDHGLRQASALVDGCESDAWLYHCQINNKHYFIADADARIVKGLLVLLLFQVQGKTSEQLQSMDIVQWFEQHNLLGHLSPSRGNGLHALIKRIHQTSN
ncbi:SufE family protein [Paraferrimonas haliotis]|uniref:Fe-S metabolism protein SufE n=1 Tax=Paraferrimonas haliotis TaxID=2013866 RepID=A0AA37TSR9_9GAMM|nr:SufE family protein [Paraferrimonas haliotis]GLS82419.1 Fe-S metabolism protein SufE [Paraferrimonas haliotis]